MTDCVVPNCAGQDDDRIRARAAATLTSSSRPLNGERCVSVMSRSGSSRLKIWKPSSAVVAVMTRVVGVCELVLRPVEKIGLGINDENGLSFFHRRAISSGRERRLSNWFLGGIRRISRRAGWGDGPFRVEK